EPAGRGEHGELVDARSGGDGRRGTDDCETPRLDGRSPESPQRLGDDGHHDRLDAVKYASRLRQVAIMDVAPRNRGNDQEGRQDEGRPGDQQATPAAPGVADVQRELCRVRPWNQVRRPDEIEELAAREPS